MKILVTSDFHGNPQHIKQIEQAVKDTHPDIFVYAGDLGPLRQDYGEPDTQRDYVVRTFFDVVEQVECPLKYVMPGNTDFQLAIDYYSQKYQNPAKCQFCTDGNLTLNQLGYNLQFLSSVSYTTHCLKDTEHINQFHDDHNQFERAKVIEHIFSKTQSEIEATLDSDIQFIPTSDHLKYSTKFFKVYQNYDDVPEILRKRLQHTIYQILCDTKPKNELPTLLISHSPPYGCNADLVKKDLHVGSADIRQYVQENPNVEAVFCGHIHQSFIISGDFQDKIGTTSVFSTGNTGIDGPQYFLTCYFLFYDTEAKKCKRLAYTCQHHHSYLKRKFE